MTAIRGNIAEAAFADVMQLLALGRRTGRLTAARDGELGTVYFVDGAVAHATLAHRRDPLGVALVRCGALDDADLRAALVEQAAEPGVQLGALLVRRGSVSNDVLLAHVTTHTQEAAYELLGWTRGTFSFDVDVAPIAAEITPRIDVGAILLEAARRTDEGVVIATEVPGPTSVFAIVAGSTLGDTPALSDVAGRVIGLIDGARDVQAIAEWSGLSVFHVSRALYELVRAGRARRITTSRAGTGAPRVSATRADEHLNLGIAFSRAGLLDDALRELRRVLELRPDDVHARIHLGGVALRAGRYDEAVAVLGEAASRPGVTAAGMHALAVARHRLGQLDLADDAFARASALGLAADPRHLTARAALALDRRDWGAARGLLDRARALCAEPPAVWYHYAVLAALGVADRDGAGEIARAGMAAHPRAAALLANLAAFEADFGGDRGRAQALPRVMGAVAERPELAAAQRLLGDLQYRAGQVDRARDAYTAATRLTPDASASAWARLGNLALRGGDRVGARHAWERACSLHPEHPTARANLDALSRSGADAPPDP